jgi:hypothetical protein
MKILILLSIWFAIFQPSFGSPDELKILYDRKVDYILQDYVENGNQIPIW